MNFVDRLRFAVHQLHRDHIPCGISDADGNYLVLELRGSALRIASQDKAWMFEGDTEQQIAMAMEVFGWSPSK